MFVSCRPRALMNDQPINTRSLVLHKYVHDDVTSLFMSSKGPIFRLINDQTEVEFIDSVDPNGLFSKIIIIKMVGVSLL